MRNILLVSLISFVIVGCGPKVEPMVATQKTPESTFVDQMVAKAGGDPSKLAPEERTKMDAITRGNTDMVIRAGKK